MMPPPCGLAWVGFFCAISGLARGRSSMFVSVILYYYLMKAVFLFSLVRILVKFETMKDHWLFLGILYTAGITFLSYVFLMAPQDNPDWRSWQIWLAKFLGLSTLYFYLLSKFDEGVIFWTVLLLGMLLVWF
jgi:hypothetical protein